IVGALLLTLFAAVYVLLFTGFGNDLVAPLIASRLEGKLELNVNIENFKLRIDRFALALTLAEKNRIEVEGSYALFSQSIDARYRIRFDDLERLKALTRQVLKGRLHADGIVKGTLKALRIEGKSNLAQSDTVYRVTLDDFNPSGVHVEIKAADLKKLLYLGGQPNLISGKLDLDFQLDSLDLEDLQGQVDIQLSRGVVNIANIKKHYGISLPKTSFSARADARLAGKDIRYDVKFVSNLAKIGSSGTIAPQTMAMDLAYNLAVKKLELFTPVIGMQMRGPLKLVGTVNGDKKHLRIKGQSDLAGSQTRFEAEFQDFKPKAIQIDIKHLKLKSLLFMLAQPSYAGGTLDARVTIDDARAESLKGRITTTLSNGKVDVATVAREFDLKVPEIRFNAETTSILKENLIDTAASVTSSLASLNVKRARFNVKEALLTSDYRVDIPDLDKLYLLTERHLDGAVRITGEIKKGKDLDVKAYADTLGGAFDAKLHNDDLHAELKNLQTMEIMKMLIYPQVFESSLTGILDYNLKTRKGKLDATLAEGRFVPNVMTILVDQLAGFDLSRERFEGHLTSSINGEKIVAELALRSNNASVTGEGVKLNTKTKQIDARLHIVANDNPIDVNIRGHVGNPKVDVDVKNLLKREAEKYIEKQIGPQFEKLLKGLFK
ncbi:MAG: hypothetical protein V3S16_11255, partial [Candidatus Desulfatibia sp.]|uniref:hypothetical protein n=1 Tax=Candidatus Desulfatibia sp. TaxID=3101189 RepID=UPI002F2ECE11